MPKLEFNRIVLVALAVLSIGVLAGIAAISLQGSRSQTLALAAGSKDGESYILSAALKKVVERHYPRIRLTLLETGGTSENLQMLESGQAQMAAAQADLLPGSSARVVAVLYDDQFQLLARKDSSIRGFADLRGRRIALARSGGQFQSFLHVAEHFGLREPDFVFVGESDGAADEAFATGNADAIFRVRALGNPFIQRMTKSGEVRFLPIEHAAAMKIEQPAFEPAIIPQGAYLGNPPVPPENLATVAVHRTLLANSSANEDAVRAITGVLYDRRQEVMEEIPPQMAAVRLLLAQIRRPESQAGLGPPVHPGALSFYEKDKPSFLQAHADYVGLILTVVLMVGSWIWELKRWIQRQQKNTADRYSNRAVRLMNSAQETSSVAALDSVWSELLSILTEAVHDLDEDNLSEESFDSFRSVLELALDVTKERRSILSATVETARASSGL